MSPQHQFGDHNKERQILLHHEGQPANKDVDFGFCAAAAAQRICNKQRRVHYLRNI